MFATLLYGLALPSAPPSLGCSYRTLITVHLEDGLEEKESVGYQRATAGPELEASVV